jgi:hypothetical protein
MPRRIRTTEFQAAGGAQPLDGYFDRVLKYIPADVVGAWVAVTGILKSNAEGDPNADALLWGVFAFGLVFTAWWTWFQTREPGQPSATQQTLIATLAFAVWVAALGGPFLTVPGFRELYGSLALIAFTLISGRLVPKQ